MTTATQSHSSQVVEVLGRRLSVHTELPLEDLWASIELLEQTFQDMEAQCRLRWEQAQIGSDTSSWLLLGAMNLAHRVVRLEQEANQHTQDLEQTLSKLLHDVPDEPSPSTPDLFEGSL